MKRRVKNIIAAFIWQSGAGPLLRLFFESRLIAIAYHRVSGKPNPLAVSPRAFAAHIAYDEGDKPDEGGKWSPKLTWVRELVRLTRERADSKELIRDMELDFFKNRIFVLTPKGEVIELPEESTPLDFAYAIHSDIGDHCEQARLGGKIIPLSHALEDGDTVEIVINKKKKPSPDWLKIVKTSKARSKIKERLKLTA